MSETAQLPEYDLIWTEMHDPDGTRYRSGDGVIVRGANVPREAMEAAVNHAHGDDWHHVIVEVQHLWHQPRVKWCSRVTGWGCDNEGEWHAHWHGVKHNPAATDCCYTLALPVWTPTTPSTDAAEAAGGADHE